MKTLQLWFGDSNDIIKSYMRSVIKYTPNMEHYFIGPESASVEGQIVLDYQTEMDKAYIRLGNKDWWNIYCTENKFKADMLRLAWALDNSDLLYVDADVKFLSEPNLLYDEKLPLMGRSSGLQEFFLFYVNNCSNWFQELIDYTVSKPVIKFAFMETFKDIIRYKSLEAPVIWDNGSFWRGV